MKDSQLILENILTILKEKGIKEKQCLVESNINTSFFTDWKSGKLKNPSIDKICKIANYLGCSVDYLLGRTDNSKIHQYKYDIMAKKYIIGYIDLLGIKKQMSNENQSSVLQAMHSIYSSIINVINTHNENQRYKLVSKPIEIKIFSDNILLALEYDEETFMPYLYYMCNVLMIVQSQLLIDKKHHFFLRGSVCVGDLYIDNVFACGSGLVEAYCIEDKKARFPRILLEDSLAMRLISFLKTSNKANEIFVRDYDGEYYLNYLHYVTDSELLAHGHILNQNASLNKDDKKIINKINWAKLYYNNHCKEIGKSELMFNDINIDDIYGKSSDFKLPKYSLADNYGEDEFSEAARKEQNEPLFDTFMDS